MPTKEELRQHLRENLDETMRRVNMALRGEEVDHLEDVLQRLGRGGHLPHWYAQLQRDNALPNLDGKTVGSVIEMIFVAVLEKHTFAGMEITPLRINPARGIDLPNLDLGIKSPSTNFCTSEPFFSAYERLLGNEYDIVVMLTDYQEAKKNPPLRLQITDWRYLKNTEVADENLCKIALKHRDWLISQNEAWAKKLFKFLAFVNQSDWRAKILIRLVDNMRDDEKVQAIITDAVTDFAKQNRKRASRDVELIPEEDLSALQKIAEVTPKHLGVIDAADNWVTEVQKELGRVPNDNEWNRLLASPLNGKIGMSYALQWRYNFGRLFGAERDMEESEQLIVID